MASQAIAKGTSQNNGTEDPPKSCIFEKVVILNTADALAIGHCETVRGNVEVTDFVDSILRLDHLAKIEGSLIITNSATLMRVDAYSLRVVTETFKMERLQSLGLIETPNLTSVKTIDWKVLPLLSQAALGNLKDVQSITISDTSLVSISGFAGTDLENLDINNNRFMEQISFDAEKVTNTLHVTGNANNLQVKLAELKEARNISMSNIRDLNMTKLRKVSFPSLSEIGGLFRLADNRAATQATFDAVLDIGGGVLIEDNTVLHKISFLSNLRSIGGALELVGDINETEWKSLKMVKGSISLRSTDQNFDCNKWISGPIRNTLRGGEIECFSRKEKALTAPGGSSGKTAEHLSQSAKQKICEWLVAGFIIVLSFSV
ncbi:hypothetical protein HF325_005149 [Metschnikowia pulcherrima]|uniref:Sporulation-specific protein 22 n=1 Tax=Metschnikowia pulcherrima TaxID=27326 RepID=A0A8H7GNF4_9ASCO|nr:hypothetical protein HF325_005149 [Metschnikowia pulcherrima]